MVDTQPVQAIPPVTDKNQLYIPSSVEKKRAVLMYLLLGIMWSLGESREESEYERFHLKQAIGRWTVFVLILIASVILLFIPLIKYLPLIIILILIIILAIFFKQAVDGRYGRNVKSGLSLFSGIGEWILGLFEIKQ